MRDRGRQPSRNGQKEKALTFDRLPPQNLEAEVGVLGAVLLDNRTLDDVTTVLEATDFFRDSHQMIYEAIVDLYSKGKLVDPLILCDELQRRGKFEDVGGDEAIMAIVGSVPHAASAKYHAQIVKEKSTTRQLVTACTEVIADAYSNEHTADELVERAMSLVLQIGNPVSEYESIPFNEAIDRTWDRITARRDGAWFGVPTGFEEVDQMIGGCLANGHLIVVGARPSMGKTAFGINVCENNVLNGNPCAFISIEMAELELVERMLASESRIAGNVLKEPWRSDLDWAALGAAATRLRDKPFHLVDAPGVTLNRIGAIARREKARHAVKLLVIDYAQLIAGTGDGDQRRNVQEINAKIARGLKRLARELKIPVMVLAQLNRGPEQREDHRPRLADLRDSGGWENEGDVVMLLNRPDYYDVNDRPRLAEVIVAKNRNGGTGTVNMTFIKERTRFVDGEPANLGNPHGGPF